jgi:SAM-dependent methyltransferase
MKNEYAKTAEFYDQFNKKLVSDYIFGNARVSAQLSFFESIVDKNIKSILIVGCGLGDVTYKLAQKHASVRVIGVDISPQNIHVAKKLFSASNLEFRCLNIITDKLDGAWDLILFPDVYEHIPVASRSLLHISVNQLLSKHGVCAFTCPTVEHQTKLKESGKGLQIIDEDVTLADMDRFALDVDARLVFFAYISVWSNGDYFHSLVSRRVTDGLDPVNIDNYSPVGKSCLPLSKFLVKIKQFQRRKYVARRLGKNFR